MVSTDVSDNSSNSKDQTEIIEQFEDDEAGSTQEIDSQVPKKDFTLDSAKEVINEYLDNAPEIDIMARNTLKSDFIVEGKEIVFLLANPLEKEKVESEKGALINHLRRVFQDKALSVSYKVNVAVGNSRPYTPKEKFDAMIAKNPVLGKLKDKLGLDTDY